MAGDEIGDVCSPLNRNRGRPRRVSAGAVLSGFRHSESSGSLESAGSRSIRRTGGSTSTSTISSSGQDEIFVEGKRSWASQRRRNSYTVGVGVVKERRLSFAGILVRLDLWRGEFLRDGGSVRRGEEWRVLFAYDGDVSCSVRLSFVASVTSFVFTFSIAVGVVRRLSTGSEGSAMVKNEKICDVILAGVLCAFRAYVGGSWIRKRCKRVQECFERGENCERSVYEHLLPVFVISSGRDLLPDRECAALADNAGFRCGGDDLLCHVNGVLLRQMHPHFAKDFVGKRGVLPMASVCSMDLRATTRDFADAFGEIRDGIPPIIFVPGVGVESVHGHSREFVTGSVSFCVQLERSCVNAECGAECVVVRVNVHDARAVLSAWTMVASDVVNTLNGIVMSLPLRLLTDHVFLLVVICCDENEHDDELRHLSHEIAWYVGGDGARCGSEWPLGNSVMVDPITRVRCLPGTLRFARSE